MLLLVKCCDNKMIKSPFNCGIFPLTQPQVANQQKNKKTPPNTTGMRRDSKAGIRVFGPTYLIF